jgi:hypothetical protein
MIKNIVLLVFLTLYTTIAISQTQEETEGWILKQTEFNLEGRLKYAIEDGELISSLTLPYALGGETIQKAIPISQITKISFVHTDKYLSYSLMCDKPCAYQADEPDDKQTKFLFEIYKKQNSSFPPRMQKALLHLIKLYGGEAKMIKHEVQKEAF